MTGVQKIIKEKPVLFAKKYLKDFYFDELILSKFIPELTEREEYYDATRLKRLKDNPRKMVNIANMYRTLEKHYPFEDYDYDLTTYLETATWIYDTYNTKIQKFITKRLSREYSETGKAKTKGDLDPLDVFKEQVARGFIPYNLSKLSRDHHWYVQSTICNLVFPVKCEEQKFAIRLQEQHGLIGYTGINTPKNK